MGSVSGTAYVASLSTELIGDTELICKGHQNISTVNLVVRTGRTSKAELPLTHLQSVQHSCLLFQGPLALHLRSETKALERIQAIEAGAVVSQKPSTFSGTDLSTPVELQAVDARRSQ